MHRTTIRNYANNIVIFSTLIIVTSAFKEKRSVVPSDIRTASVYLFQVESFETWKQLLDTIPPGMDDWAQHYCYNRHVKSHAELCTLLNHEKIRYTMVTDKNLVPKDSVNVYLLDYKPRAIGGEQEFDWWTCCLNGYFFVHPQSGNRYDYMGDIDAARFVRKGLRKLH